MRPVSFPGSRISRISGCAARKSAARAETFFDPRVVRDSAPANARANALRARRFACSAGKTRNRFFGARFRDACNTPCAVPSECSFREKNQAQLLTLRKCLSRFRPTQLTRDTVIEIGIQLRNTREDDFAHDSTSVVPGPVSLRKSRVVSDKTPVSARTRAFSFAASPRRGFRAKAHWACSKAN
jgi:hypothetical protein